MAFPRASCLGRGMLRSTDTTKHHVLVTVLSRQRELKLKAKIIGNRFFFFPSSFFLPDELCCLSDIQPCSQLKGLILYPGKEKPSRAVGERNPWRTWACLIKELLLAPRDSPSSAGGSGSSPDLPLEAPDKLSQSCRLLCGPWFADSCSALPENGALARRLPPGARQISPPEHLGHTVWPRCT